MYAESDFILALIKDGDWLSEAAEKVYEENREELWTSEYALLELMMVAYREDRDVLKTVSAVSQLIELRGDENSMLAAASHVEENGFTPFDALHLVKSGDDTIVSSDGDYDSYSDRLALEEQV
ncbi:MAG: PIN domain-containing protein [Candidatus Nanohaloarchaea archaeon]